jgi:hypothetical protein
MYLCRWYETSPNLWRIPYSLIFWFFERREMKMRLEWSAQNSTPSEEEKEMENDLQLESDYGIFGGVV